MDKKFENKLNLIKKLISGSTSEPVISSTGMNLIVSFDNRDEIIGQLSKEGIFSEPNGIDKIDINIIRNCFRLFYSENHFLKSFRITHSDGNFVLFFNRDEYLVYDNLENCYWDNSGRNNNNNISNNTIYYHKILNILSDDSNPDNFCTHHDSAHNKIIIISHDKGKMEIIYPMNNPKIPLDKNIESFFGLLKDKLNTKGFSSFFKNDVFDFLKHFNKTDNFVELTKNLDTIIESANSNFEVYLSGFSVKKLIDDVRIEKEKYFNNLRDIISKIYNQTISVPIVISAAVFSMYKIGNDSIFGLFLILTGYIIFSSIVLFLLVNLKNDTKELKNDLKIDITRIKNESESTYYTISDELTKVNKKIINTQCTINIFILIQVFLIIALIIFFLYQIEFILSLSFCLFKILYIILFSFVNM